MKGKQVSLFDNVYIDHFAGGGGASTGIEMATGQPVDVAINHDEMAIALHRKNHPYTKHYRDVYGNEIKRSEQVAKCGNAVCPAVAEALVRANLSECPRITFVDMRALHQAMVS